MTKMIKIVNNNLKTAIINMHKDLKGKHEHNEKKQKLY